MAKCLQCGKEYEAKRSTARYCSAKCRKLAFHKNGKVSVPEVSVPSTVTPKGITIPEGYQDDTGAVTGQTLPANFGQIDCQCMHCQQNRRSNHKLLINHGDHKPANQLMKNEVNRVSLPGDIDYDGVCSSKLPNNKCWCCGNDIPGGTVCCGPCAWSGRAKEKRAGRYPPLLTDRTPKQMENDLHTLELTGGLSQVRR